MALWAEVEIVVSQPKTVNIKDIVVGVVKKRNPNMVETVVESFYSKGSGVKVGLRTTDIGERFDVLLSDILKELRKSDVGFFTVELKRNWYLG